MASVHLARVDGPGGFQKWVAIKRIHPHLVEDDQFVDMFLDEARIAAGINHANVAQVFDLGKDDNTYWIAMEYLHGEPLREIMRRLEEVNEGIPYGIASRVVSDAAEGLHGAHELRGRNGQLLNLVHRDVTPHNLFVTYEGYTKVVDFGIAKVVDRLASTRAGTLKGKLAYMSPEQVRGQEVDRRTDIFALGVVLWELTTSRRLFRMETDLDTLEKVQACVVPLPSSLVPNYPKDLEQVVLRALAQRKEDRFQTTREFSRALQSFLMRQGTFVGPEDVAEYAKRLFADRVAKRERYLEWAAEVTNTIDLDSLRGGREDGGGAHAAVGRPISSAPPPSSSHVAARASPLPPPPQRSAPSYGYSSSGQDTMAAAVVATRPAQRSGPGMQPLQGPSVQLQPPQALAQTSLLDEDEDIPTVVSASHASEPPRAGPRPAAGRSVPPASGGWQPAQPQSDLAELDSTIALPDGREAEEIRMRLDEMDRQRVQGGPYGAGQFGGSGSVPPPPQQVAAMQAAQLPPIEARQMRRAQGVVETKMSLPRPTAVTDWLLEQGEVQMPPARSTGVLMAIALLSTLCVLGVGALVIFKLREPLRPPLGLAPGADPPPLVLPAADRGPGSSDAAGGDGKGDGVPEATRKGDGNGGAKKSNGKDGARTGKADAAATASADKSATPAKEPPGTLTIVCEPACDQVIADGRALGPSPVVNHVMDPGAYRITARKKGYADKVIVVQVFSRQSTSKPIKMTQ
jgi:serine/threonine-protein kinase